MRLARRALVGALLSTLFTTGCGVSNLSFRVDTRVKITSPKNRSVVELPVALTWTVRDFDVKSSPTSSGGSFAIFVDRSPIPPGKKLSWLARNDSACTSKPTCPDPAYLAQLGVYQTTGTSLVLSSVKDESDSTSKTSRHFATIVLLDDEGKRIGEIAYNVNFELKRKGS